MSTSANPNLIPLGAILLGNPRIRFHRSSRLKITIGNDVTLPRGGILTMKYASAYTAAALAVCDTDQHLGRMLPSNDGQREQFIQTFAQNFQTQVSAMGSGDFTPWTLHEQRTSYIADRVNGVDIPYDGIMIFQSSLDYVQEDIDSHSHSLLSQISRCPLVVTCSPVKTTEGTEVDISVIFHNRLSAIGFEDSHLIEDRALPILLQNIINMLESMPEVDNAIRSAINDGSIKDLHKLVKTAVLVTGRFLLDRSMTGTRTARVRRGVPEPVDRFVGEQQSSYQVSGSDLWGQVGLHFKVDA